MVDFNEKKNAKKKHPAASSNVIANAIANKTAPVIDDDGFESLPVIEGEQQFEQSEWVEPGEGVVIEGALTRAFVVRDTLGGDKGKAFRACYGVESAEYGALTFGEKASFKEQIRKLNLGDSIKLTFLHKEALKANGRPTGKTVWRVKFGVKRTDKPGLGVLPTLFQSHADLVTRGEDLPF